MTYGIIAQIILALCCYYVANKNGRNPWLALILGVLFGIITLIVYVIIGKKK
ncbi:MAG: hypothetical protein IKH95_08635 [Bacteroidaceae bacterium]|nr:hypothetical protein [Bacteroidaceae bacterium]